MARAATPSPRPPPSAVAAAASSPMKPPPARFPQQRRATLVRSLPLPRPPKGGGLKAAPPRRRVPSSCACSPTTHPGSFRCALHRSHPSSQAQPPASSGLTSAPRRASMANPLVRVAAAEGGGGDNIRRSAMASVARPPQHRRRAHAFRPGPSRLSVVSSAGEEPPRRPEEK
ncbi:hypothetical protein HU200_013263 [Digitaria exilis]|uniref:Uncharacterized protein n=1 Tax=Digitaria exilis TaxID=1010633 RepID=A0A835KL63_9POAL|nr:hypothetical protein HU200_013263 [Digitaria exilis]